MTNTLNTHMSTNRAIGISTPQRSWGQMDRDIFVVATWYHDAGGARLPELFEGVGFLQGPLPDVDELEQRIARLEGEGVLEPTGDRWKVTHRAWAAVLRTRACAHRRHARGTKRLLHAIDNAPAAS
jgi:hypothetical protein